MNKKNLLQKVKMIKVQKLSINMYIFLLLYYLIQNYCCCYYHNEYVNYIVIFLNVIYLKCSISQFLQMSNNNNNVAVVVMLL